MKLKKKPTRFSISKYPLLIESGTKEYKKKKKIEIEKIDAKGIFRRARVVDQKVFDKLFIEEKITRQQYAAASMYMEVMGIAGCFLRSPSMEGSEKGTGRDLSQVLAGKILVIARARDKLRKAGDKAIRAVENCIAFDQEVNLNDLRTGLDALADHFGVE